MDTNIIAGRFMDLLRERIDTETGQAIILKLIETMDAESASAIADECEDFVRYREYLSEDEAEDIVRKFVNFDGSRGAHWEDPDEAFQVLQNLNIRFEEDGRIQPLGILRCPEHDMVGRLGRASELCKPGAGSPRLRGTRPG